MIGPTNGRSITIGNHINLVLKLYCFIAISIIEKIEIATTTTAKYIHKFSILFILSKYEVIGYGIK